MIGNNGCFEQRMDVSNYPILYEEFVYVVAY